VQAVAAPKAAVCVVSYFRARRLAVTMLLAEQKALRR
jgi:hypothetical protein